MTTARLRLLVDGAAPGAWNMALDEALMEAARRGTVTLRLYFWTPPCLSLGRNQPARNRYDAAAAAARGIQIVRRPTGGRAVYHDREVTYAVTAPERLWGGPRAAYARINRALARGLRSMGAPVSRAPERPGAALPVPGLRACFRDPAPGEVTAGSRKLVGSAVWRRAGAILQHGSVLIHDDQHVADELRLGSAEATGGGATGPVRGAARASAGLADVCPRPPDPDRLVAALVEGFEEEFGLLTVRSEPDGRELREAKRREVAFAGDDWTWRR